MNALQVFDFRGAHVRTSGTAAAPLFCASDVCAVLEIENVGNALARLDQDEQENIRTADAQGKNRAIAFVNESGLYSLILGSRKPEAKAFKRWVTAELLPALRQRGHYSLPGAQMPIDVLAHFERRFDALLAPFLATVQTFAKAASEMSGATIARPDAIWLKHEVRDVARLQVRAGLVKPAKPNKSPEVERKSAEASARRRIYNKLGASTGWLGTGRDWRSLPATRWPDARALLVELRREVEALLPRPEQGQLKLVKP